MFGTPKVDRLKRRGNVPALVKALHHADASVRSQAAEALGEVTGADAAGAVVPVLLEVMGTDVCPVAGPAATAVSGLAAAGARVPVAGLLDELIRSREWHRRGTRACDCRKRSELFWKSMQLLADRADSSHLPLLLGVLGMHDVQLRQVAAHVLKAVGDPAAIPPLLAQLRREPYGQVPHRLVFDAVASFRDPATVERLLRWLAGTPPLSDHGAYLGFTSEVDALCEMAPPGLDVRLAGLITADRCPRQRKVLQETVAERLGNAAAARAATARVEQAARRAPLDRAVREGARGLDALVRYLSDEDAAFREDARSGLGALDDPRMHSVLVGLLHHDDAENRRFAAAELGRRGDRRALFPLIDLHRRDGELRPAAAASLARLGARDVDGFLLAALSSRDLRPRALARLDGDRRAIEPLRTLVADPHRGYHVRALAQARLAELGEADSPVPEPLTDTDPEPGDRRGRTVALLRDTLAELRIGRNLGATPYRIEAWEEDRRRVLALPAGHAPPPVPGGELPAAYRSESTGGSGRLFLEEYEHHDHDFDSRERRWRTLGYHWDVREGQIGTYFDATVDDRGTVEFGGGRGARHPADPDGWRALVADINTFRNKDIRLWVPYELRD